MRSRANVMAIALLAPVLLLAGCGGGGGAEDDNGAASLNAGIAIAGSFPGGVGSFPGFVFALVSEIEQGSSDLNGDGDTSDEVVHMVTLATGAVTNLGIAGSPGFAANASFIAWGTSELDQDETDLNGDGDANDRILTIFNPNMPISPTNPMITGVTMSGPTPLQGEGDIFAFSTSEVSAQLILNGDGIADDFVMRTFNTATMTTFNTGLAHDSQNLAFSLRNGILAFEVSEDEESDPTAMMPMGIDYNGDTDMEDFVLFIADPVAMTVTPAGPGAARAIDPGSFIVIGTPASPAVVYAVDEMATMDPVTMEGSNFNNGGLFLDADSDDTIAAIFDVNSGLEFFPGGGIGIQPSRLSGSGTRVVISVPEDDNGATDINNDGDSDDVIPFWVDLANPTDATSVGLAMDPDETSILPICCNNHFVFAASESMQGPNGTNFNSMWFDTDTDDMVPHFVDTSVNPVIPFNTTFAGAQVICDTKFGEFVIVVANEGENGFDFTDDQANDDEAIFYFGVVNDAIDPNPTYVRVGNGNISVQSCANVVRFIAFSEEMEGDPESGDMNFDGDFDDFVLFGARLQKANATVNGVNVYGTVDPNVAMNSFPFIADDLAVAYPTLESSLGNGARLNGDGDSFDSVLQLVTFDCP